MLFIIKKYWGKMFEIMFDSILKALVLGEYYKVVNWNLRIL